MRILSIDPGFERLGLAILEKKSNQKEMVIFSTCFKTERSLSFSKRLFSLGQKIEKVIKKWKPEAFSIETLFLTTNQKTAMRVAEVRGVAIYQAEKAGLQIFEYSPLQVKMTVTGYGKATKDQVIRMVSKLTQIKDNKTSDDELDAIAIGLTCLARERFPPRKSPRPIN